MLQDADEIEIFYTFPHLFPPEPKNFRKTSHYLITPLQETLSKMVSLPKRNNAPLVNNLYSNLFSE